MLEIDNLHVTVEGKEVLHGVNLIIPDQEVHALFGPNGSGKSVLISTIMGYPEFEITQGTILYNGQRLDELSIDERVKRGISVMEQRPPVVKGVTLAALVKVIQQYRRKNACEMKAKKVEQLIKRLDMTPFLARNINEGFSGGEIKKSELFLLMLAQPSFVILDEPDSGVDPEHLKRIGLLINEVLRPEPIWPIPTFLFREVTPGKAGLIVTHSAAILDYLSIDKAHVLVDGRIKCSGDPGEMMVQIREKGYAYCITCHKKPAHTWE